MNTLLAYSSLFEGDLLHGFIRLAACVIALAVIWWLIQFIREPFLVQLCRIVFVVLVAIALIMFILGLG